MGSDEAEFSAGVLDLQFLLFVSGGVYVLHEVLRDIGIQVSSTHDLCASLSLFLSLSLCEAAAWTRPFIAHTHRYTHPYALVQRMAKSLCDDHYQQLSWQYAACDVVGHAVNIVFAVQSLAWVMRGDETTWTSWLTAGYPHGMAFGLKVLLLANIGYFLISAQLVNVQKVRWCTHA